MTEPRHRELPPPPGYKPPEVPRRVYPKPTPPSILTQDKGVRDHYEKGLADVKHHCQCLSQNVAKDDRGKFTKDFLGHLKKAADAFHDMRGVVWPRYPIQVAHCYRREVGEMVHQFQLVDKVLCKYVVELLPDRGVSSDRKTVLECCMRMLLDYSQSTPNVTMDMVQHPLFLATAVNFLDTAGDKSSGFQEKMTKWTLYQVFNVSRFQENHQHIEQAEVFDAVAKYVRCPKPYLQLAALACLSYLAKEKDCKVFRTSQDSIDFLLKKLNQSMKDNQLQVDGWHRREMVEVVGQLARNDSNRGLLVDRGCLPLIADLANADDILDEKVALTTLWHLVLGEKMADIREAVRQQWNLIPIVLKKCQFHADPEVRHLASGILWDMREELGKDDKYRDIVPKMKEQMHHQASSPRAPGATQEVAVWTPGAKAKEGQAVVAFSAGWKVMLSYNHTHKEIVTEIKEFLVECGFQVWFDKTHMTGNIIRAMAEGIDTSHIVFLCYSPQYRESPNCESEANYAREQSKEIVPIKVERDYKPDGWLGFIIAGKLFFDFSGKYPIELKKQELLQELEKIVTKRKGK